jgi:tRNA pseudouridine55 synthase
MNADAPDGLILVDKPAGPTSRAVLDDIEGRLRIGPLGHAGTLDPRATGLLVVLAGAARRLQGMFLDSGKTYEATIALGATSRTDDGEGPIEPTGRAVPDLEPGLLREVLARFTGELQQVPPAFSALHVHGRRAHALARSGLEPELQARRVVIESLELLEQEGPELQVRVRCGPGTYVRALARDLGAALGCGGWLRALRRTASGAWNVQDALPPERVTRACLRPLPEALADRGRVDMDLEGARRLAHGATIPLSTLPGPAPCFAWYAGRPLCRLLPLEGGLARSDLLLGPQP